VLGLLCCARGAGGPEVEWLAQMNALSMEVRAYARANANGQPLLREPALCDFQMVGSGYDDSDLWQSLLIPKTSEGKKAGADDSKNSNSRFSPVDKPMLFYQYKNSHLYGVSQNSVYQ
jgi:CRISPR system Cascade subunit CasD